MSGSAAKRSPKRILARNLTARADSRVRGNPDISRPESGVDNCYPGLEFDQRNLDKSFFPGLTFEFHRSDGAFLHAILPSGFAAQQGLTETDLPLSLWAILGRMTLDQQEASPPALFFRGLDGLEVWRRVHDLMPGRIAILLGSGSGFDSPGFNRVLAEMMADLRSRNASQITRDNNGAFELAVLVADRARYLDDDGVIDTEVFAPGDLTRSLCAPWQFDFRDCGCFYWAASKPDVVSSADGKRPYLNFMRADRAADPGGNPLAQWEPAQEIDHAALISGAWSSELPVVLDDREEMPFVPGPVQAGQHMTREEVIAELQYLATVEHALCVEYLYAHYSVKAPQTLPLTGGDALTRRIFAAAHEVFQIAIDEMRHLRWVNEALDLLGQKPVLDRAQRIGRQFGRPFELLPLTQSQLQWFVDVEKPSQAIDEGLDGMYVRLHRSIDEQPQLFPERERLVHLIKLIIDEGGEHYERFVAVQQHLAGLREPEYLRSLDDPAPGSLEEALGKLSDENYEVLLGSLAVTLSLGDQAAGLLLEQSRRAMFNLHEINHRLAASGKRPRFTLPALPAALASRADAHVHVDAIERRAEAALDAVAAIGPDEGALADRQRRVNEALFARLRTMIDRLGQ